MGCLTPATPAAPGCLPAVLFFISQPLSHPLGPPGGVSVPGAVGLLDDRTLPKC